MSLRQRLALASALALGVPAGAHADAGAAIRAVGADYLSFLEEDNLWLRLKHGLPIDHLPEVSPAKALSDGKRAAALLARLEALPAEPLAEEDSLSRRLLLRRLQADAREPRFYWLEFPVTPYSSPLGAVHQAFRLLPLKDAPGAERFVALLGAYPALVGQIRAKLEGQAERGIRLPKDELPLVEAFLRGAAAEGDASPFFVSKERLAALPDRDAFERAAEAKAAEASRALRGLIAYLKGDYAAGGSDGVGLGQYAGGGEYYAHLVRLHTTLDVTPEEVHRIGLQEVEALDARMAEVRRGLGFAGTAAAFRESIRQNSRFRPKSADEIGERLMAYVTRIGPRVDAFFLRRPKAPYGVKRLEREREGAMTFGEYNPPVADEPRGLYFFNGSNPEERSLLTAGPLIYHELVPGHHFQIAIAEENDALPAFRRELADTAYTEGWAEYASALAEEMGMYQDPYDLYGRLSMDMFLSTRLVVDTGMNAMGWSRARAVGFMREHLMESDTQIETESLRYAVDMPGQALAYKMGSRTLWALRSKAARALGPKFDVRRFHDCLLASGSLPLDTLSRKVDAFIAREAAR